MTPERRAQLEAAGHIVTTAESFFGLNEFDQRINAIRTEALHAIRYLSDQAGLSQRELNERLKLAQARIVTLGYGANADLDLILNVFVLVGGQSPELGSAVETSTRAPRLSRFSVDGGV